MMILSNFVAQKTLAWTSIHSWVTNSTVEDLLYRLLFFASDVYNINYIHRNNPCRAREIASSKSVLTTLIGNNVRLVPDSPINADCFLHLQSGLMNDWRKVALAFNAMNHNLKELKYGYSDSDPNLFDAHPMSAILNAKEVLIIDGHELRSDFMPMPVLGVLCPVFR